MGIGPSRASLPRQKGVFTKSIAALFVRRDSIYKTFEEVDCYDAERDAKTWKGGCPAVAHPPCRTWSMLAPVATRATPGEKALAVWAISQVRKNGGVLEHPKGSKVFEHCHCGTKEKPDRWGGFVIEVDQFHWGHRAAKPTRLYVVGTENLPPMPRREGAPTHCITQGHGVRVGHPRFKPRVPDREREATPPEFARWLVELARSCNKASSTKETGE